MYGIRLGRLLHPIAKTDSITRPTAIQHPRAVGPLRCPTWPPRDQDEPLPVSLTASRSLSPTPSPPRKPLHTCYERASQAGAREDRCGRLACRTRPGSPTPEPPRFSSGPRLTGWVPRRRLVYSCGKLYVAPTIVQFALLQTVISTRRTPTLADVVVFRRSKPGTTRATDLVSPLSSWLIKIQISGIWSFTNKFPLCQKNNEEGTFCVPVVFWTH